MNYSEIITDLQAQADDLLLAIRVLRKLDGERVVKNTAKDPVKPKQVRSKTVQSSDNGKRECSKCGEVRQPHEFPKKGNVCLDCKRAYQREWMKKNYVAGSNGPLPFVCEECHAKFANKAALDTHMELKHEE